MNNVKSIITKHNAHIIRNSQSQNTETDNCNCDNKNTCPLPKQCMTNNIKTFETYLEIKRKQSGLYHQMVNFKIDTLFRTQPGGSKRCNLCLEEKFCILKDINKDNLLNKRSEIFGKCRHKNRFRVNKVVNKIL